MRYYVIINGVNSLTKTGLAIKELPPITKPLMRTQKEEIDGRDGDIITELGYSSYDKQLEIGLFGEGYDINDIIAFFNSSGTIVFSNEPDKYYNFKILNQIDYDRLLKFKTATVTMHVQPFKYPLEETPVEITEKTVTVEGETLSIDNTIEAKMEIEYGGNTYQEGTPTPDNPQDIHIVSGDNSIKVVGKNLAKVTNTNISSTGYSLNIQDGLIKITTTGTINSFDLCNGTRTGNYLPSYENANDYHLTPANKGTYKLSISNISVNISGTANQIVAIYTNQRSIQPYITPSGELMGTTSFTLNEDEYVKSIYLWTNNTSTITKLNFNLQLEKGTTATTYEPYQSTTYPITLPNGMYLGKIGDYKDRIYYDNGKWYLEKKIGKVVLDGSESYSLIGINTYNIANFALVGGLPLYVGGVMNEALANYFVAQTTIMSNTETPGFFLNQSKELYLRIESSKASTMNAFKTWLSTHNTTLYYVLATPTYEEITSTNYPTLYSQLEAIKYSYDNQTNISQTNDDLPFILDVTAFIEGNLKATITNIGNIYSKPILDIEGTGTVGIYLDGNEMFSVDLSNDDECVIDTNKLEAYDPDTVDLMNRKVTGDYDNFRLNTGDNIVSVTGDIEKVTVTDYTRWL